MPRFRTISLSLDEQTELERLETATQNAIASNDSTRRREAMRQSGEFLVRVAAVHGLDFKKCTVASDSLGVRLRYEQEG